MAGRGCRAGRYRTSYRVEQQQDTKDKTGHDIEAWETVLDSRRGQFMPGTPKEYYNNAGEAASIDGKIVFRFDSALAAIGPENRIVENNGSNLIYEIIGFPQNPGNKDKELIFFVRHLNRN